MQLTIVGTGYVGLVSGTCFADTGNDVVCLDVDEQKIEMMRRGESPIYEPGLSDLLRRNIAAGRLTFTSDAEEAYREADFIFICVGTPSDDEGRADLQYVLAVAEELGRILEAKPAPEPGAPGPIVVVKSTVPVGTNDKVRAAIAEAGMTNLCAPRDLRVLDELPKLGTGKLNHREVIRFVELDLD